jgi:hypothetical protein
LLLLLLLVLLLPLLLLLLLPLPAVTPFTGQLPNLAAAQCVTQRPMQATLTAASALPCCGVFCISFPAAVPELFEVLTQNIAAGLMAISAQASSSTSVLGMLQSSIGSAACSVSSSRSSSSSSRQARVSSALLALVIVRAAVQIADAIPMRCCIQVV